MESVGNNKKNYILYFWMFLCFYVTDSPFANYAPDGYVFKVTVPMILGVAYTLYCLFIKRTSLNIIRIVMIAFIFSMIITSNILGGSGLRMTLAYVGMWLFALFLTKVYSFEDFRHVFVNSVVFIALFSLAIYMFLLADPENKYLFTTEQYSNGATVDLFFTTFRLTSGTVRRNYGMFWEPGTYQAYLNLALLFLLKDKDSKHFIAKALILIIATVTTFSTTGFIVMALILGYSLFSKRKSIKLSSFQKIGFIVLICVLIIVAISNFEMILEQVFDKMESGNASYDSRTLSILGNLVAAINYPIFGVGYGMSAEVVNQLISSASGFIHQTNTFTNYFATFGLFIGCIFIVFWAKIAGSLSKNKFEGFIVFVILTLITSGENFISSFTFIILLVYGFRLLRIENSEPECEASSLCAEENSI